MVFQHQTSVFVLLKIITFDFSSSPDDDWAYYGNELTRLWDGISVFFKSQEEGKLALLQSRLDDGVISEKQYNAMSYRDWEKE